MEIVRISDRKPVETTLRHWIIDSHHELPCFFDLSGQLAEVDVCAAPDGAPISIQGQLYLVTARTTFKEDRTLTMGVVSWSDNGTPRILAGRLMNLVSTDVHAILLLDGSAGRPMTLPPLPAHAMTTEAFFPVPETTVSDVSEEVSATIEMPTVDQSRTTKSLGWGQAISASKQQPPPAVSEHPPKVKRGDILVHPRFGRCKVVRELMFGKVKVRRPTGALLDLHTKVLAFKRVPDENGQRIFNLSIVKKTS